MKILFYFPWLFSLLPWENPNLKKYHKKDVFFICWLPNRASRNLERIENEKSFHMRRQWVGCQVNHHIKIEAISKSEVDCFPCDKKGLKVVKWD